MPGGFEAASAYVSIYPKITGGFKRSVESELSGSGTSAGKKVGGEFASGFKGAVGALGAIAVGAGMASFLKDSIGAAGDLEQSVGAIDAVFKGASGQMHKWAESASTDVGLTKNEFNELGTLIGAQLKNGGTAMEELGPKTKNLIDLGADLSSMFGGSTKDAVSALSSALKGERDPIERYGVSLTQAKIDAEAASLGFSKVGGALSGQATQAATLSLIMKQTADAQGNFGRETNTLAHQQQVLAAQFGDVKTKIGTLFLPALTAGATAMTSTFMPALSRGVDGFAAFAEGIGKAWDGLSMFAGSGETDGLAAALGISEDSVVFTVLGEVLDAYKQLRLGIEEFVNGVSGAFTDIDPANSPFVLGMFEIGKGLRENFNQLKDAFEKVLPSLQGMADSFAQNLGPALGDLGEKLLPIIEGFNDLRTDALVALMPMLGGLADVVAEVLVPAFTELADGFTKNVLPAIGRLSEVFQDVLKVVMPIVSEIVTFVLDKFAEWGPTISKYMEQVTEIIGEAIDLVSAVITKVLDFLSDFWAEWGDEILATVGTVFDTVMTIIGGALDIIQGAIKTATAIFTGDWDAAWEGIQQIVKGAATVLLGAFAGIIRGFAGMLRSLSKVPGFEWAAGAADLVDGAADSVDNLTAEIRAIPPYKKITVEVGVTGTSKLDALGRNFRALGIQGAFASGGPVLTDGLYLVGENGPEIVSLRGGNYVHNATETRGLVGSTSGGGSTTTVNMPITVMERFDALEASRELSWLVA